MSVTHRWGTGCLLLLVAIAGCGPRSKPTEPGPVPPAPATAPEYKELFAVPFLSADEAKKVADEFVSTLRGNPEKVAACVGVQRVAFTPDGKTLLAGGVDKITATDPGGSQSQTVTGLARIKLWALPAGKLEGVLEQATDDSNSTGGPYDRFTGLTVSPDGQRVWGSYNGLLRSGSKVWSLPEKKALADGVIYSNPRYHPNGKWVISHSIDNIRGGGVSVIDAETAKAAEMQSYPDGKTARAYGGETIYGGFDFSPDGAWLARVNRASTSGSGTFSVDSLKPGEKSFTIPKAAKDEWHLPDVLFFTADGRRLVGLCQREYGALETKHPSRVRAWSVADRKLLWEVEVPSHADALAVSPDGHWAAVGCGDKAVRLLATATGEEKRVLTGHGGPVNAVAFSKDGTLLASADTDTVRVWRAAE